MNQLVVCPDCGTPNRPDADLCVQCWRGMSEDVASKIPVAAFATATAGSATAVMAPPAPPPPPMAPATPLRQFAPGPTRPVTPPPVREATPGPVPYFAPVGPPATPGVPTLAGATVPAGVTAPVPTLFGSAGYHWTWIHLILFGLCAWGVPSVLSFLWAPKFSGRGMLDGILALQIGGYILAALVAVVLVHRVQGGNWATLGLSWTERAFEDLFRGAGFGLLLIGGFLGGYLAVNGGELEVDGMVRVLLGGTSGPGLVLAGLVLVVGAPFIEEIYYRGMLHERFSRWGKGAALFGTSMLFVRAHGSFLIPSLLLLAFGLGWRRQTRSLWYTIGGHAAWNAVVIGCAVFVMTGPALGFTSSDGDFTLRHPAKWDRMEEMEQALPGGSIELALQNPSGAFIIVGQSALPPGMTPRNAPALMQRMQGAMPALPGVDMTFNQMHPSTAVAHPGARTYEMDVAISEPTLGAGRARLVMVMTNDMSDLTTLVMACPEAECAAATADFDVMLKSLQYSS